jgi:transcriptional regulator with XRE-family HTH domain
VVLVASNVKRLRAEQGWTTRAFAEHSGLSLGFLYRVEHAKYRTLSLTTLDRLSQAFGVPARALLEPGGGRVEHSGEGFAKDIVARNMKALRAGKGWTQEGLAEHSGVPRTFIAEVERRGRAVSLDVLERLAKGLGVRLADLFS